jgi:hypothetical protein
MTTQDHPGLLRPRRVAPVFRVASRTISTWGKRGKLPSTRAASGRRLYAREDVAALLATYADNPQFVVDTITELASRGYRTLLLPRDDGGEYGVAVFTSPTGDDDGTVEAVYADSPAAAVLAAWLEVAL